jgi:hypothetical protein
MSTVPAAEYEGGRRGGHEDAIRRRQNLLPSYTVGQAVAALHMEPVVAYNQKTDIWASNRLYSKFFNDQTTAAHIVFSFSALRSVENKKLKLMQKARSDEESLTAVENHQVNFFRHRGSTYLLTSAISGCLETILGHSIPNLFRLSFGESVSPKDAQLIWDDIIEATTPFCIELEDAFTDGLKSAERVKKAVQRFQSLVQSTAEANKSKYQSFANKIVSN